MRRGAQVSLGRPIASSPPHRPRSPPPPLLPTVFSPLCPLSLHPWHTWPRRCWRSPAVGGPPRRRPLLLWGQGCRWEWEGGSGARTGAVAGGAEALSAGEARVRALPRALCAGRARWGRGWGGCQPSSLGVAGRSRSLGGRGLPGGSVWHWGVRTPDTVRTPPLGQCPGPVVQGFTPGTQPMSRNWGVLRLCCVVLCGAVWCGIPYSMVPCCAVL